ncbi:MAG: DJ-1/PfpI family protein [Sedimenticola sp.]|nr:DJ-1/PfpI family protein [Sedimenticola sp.]
MNIAIYLYDNAEVLDFSGPFEVFSTAARLANALPRFNVFLVGESGGSLTARGGYSVNPAYGFHNHPAIDLLIVVGGVHGNEMQKKRVLDWIALTAKQARWVASVCTGAFLLAEAGVLKAQKVTTHWEDIAELRANYPQLQVCEAKRWVDEGDIITSAGITAGIDMSLYLVSRLHSRELALRTAKQMDFEWQQNS